MKPVNIFYTSEFLRLWKKLPKEVKVKAIRKEVLFKKNIFNPQLKTHQLKGDLEGFYSFSIDYHYRIVFHLEGGNIYFDAVGTHSVYK